MLVCVVGAGAGFGTETVDEPPDDLLLDEDDDVDVDDFFLVEDDDEDECRVELEEPEECDTVVVEPPPLARAAAWALSLRTEARSAATCAVFFSTAR